MFTVHDMNKLMHAKLKKSTKWEKYAFKNITYSKLEDVLDYCAAFAEMGRDCVRILCNNKRQISLQLDQLGFINDYNQRNLFIYWSDEAIKLKHQKEFNNKLTKELQ